MGFMPFHIEKGAIGLRLDHLCRHGPTRQHVIERLQAGDNPLTIAQNIPGPDGTPIKVLSDDRLTFEAALDTLLGPGKGAAYRSDAAHLRHLNRDNPPDRESFATFWTKAIGNNPALIDEMRMKILEALQANDATGSPKEVQFWWECTLPTPSSARVEHLELPETMYVFFRTDEVPTP